MTTKKNVASPGVIGVDGPELLLLLLEWLELLDFLLLQPEELFFDDEPEEWPPDE